MKNIIYVIVILFFSIISCKDASNPIIPVQSYKPIFPQPGYNARNTSNPYSIEVNMSPVINGVFDWSFTFPGINFSDGSEFCVDSKGNIYYVSQPYPTGGLYKFSPNGDVIWKRDSIIQYNFCGISLSADEKRIYIVAFKPENTDKLYCIDSSGQDIWSIPTSTNSKPVIGKNGTIYNYHNGYLSAISEDGNVIWQNVSVSNSSGKYNLAIDREDNIFCVNQTYSLLKVNKDGGIVWQYNTGVMVYGIVIDGYGNIYFNGWTDRKLYCLSATGNLKWTKSNSNSYNSPVITSDNKILISSNSNIIKYDTAGTQIWIAQAFIGTGAESLILDDNDNVYYLGDASGGIRVGSISAEGIKRWEYLSNMNITLPPPVLIPSGKLLFAPKRAFNIQAIR